MLKIYHKYFGLRELPFSAQPETAYFFLSAQHQEAIAHLRHGICTDGGMILLTGDVGTGKTTTCMTFLSTLPSNISIAFVRNPDNQAETLLATTCELFGIEASKASGTVNSYVRLIEHFLLAQHAVDRCCLLVIDDAEKLDPSVLEQLRLLTNLETSRRKLLQILLVGRPELSEVLRRPDLRQLSQRIVSRYHLRSLKAHEVQPYLTVRLTRAGAADTLFPAQTIRSLYRVTRGVPRDLNLVCDRAMLIASVNGKSSITPKLIAVAAREVVGLNLRMAGVKSEILLYLGLAALVTMLIYLSIAVTRHARKSDPTLDFAENSFTGAVAIAAHRGPVPVSTDLETAQTSSERSVHWPKQSDQRSGAFPAFAALYGTWGALFDPKISPCQQANPTFTCVEGHGGMSELRNLNLPAVIHARDDDDQSVDVALLSIDEHGAVIDSGNSIGHVSLSLLDSHWSGSYTLLARLPAEHRTLRTGDRGSGVVWLRGALARYEQSPDPEMTEVRFNADLYQRVLHFQRSHGLEPDGVAGVKTMTRLASLLDVRAPRLTSN
jgi:general secretion pathway protein A